LGWDYGNLSAINWLPAADQRRVHGDGREQRRKFSENSVTVEAATHAVCQKIKKPLKIKGFRILAERGGFELRIGYEPNLRKEIDFLISIT
jgi:hypothetical protein